MLAEIFRFECRHQLKSALFWSVCLVFFLLAFLAMASEDVSVGGVGNNLDLNASFAIITTHFAFSIIGMFAGVAFVATAITRDFEHKMAEIVFSTSVPRLTFYFGRFAGGFLSAFLAACSAVLGTLMATFMPWLDPERIGAFSWAPYWFSIWAVMLPSMFVTSAIFFSVSAVTRSMFAAYGAALGLIVFYVVVQANTDPETIGMTALFDPFGAIAFAESTRYWTVFDRNQLVPEMTGTLLLSRVIWLGVASAALAIGALRFEFSAARGRRGKAPERALPARGEASVLTAVAQRSFGMRTVVAQFLSQTRIELRGVVRSVPFYVLLGFAMLNVTGGFVFSLSQIYGTPILPVTRALLVVIGGSYVFMVYLIIIYYSGELVHRERQTRMSEIMDATPHPSGIMVGAKIAALWFVIASLFAIVGATAVVVQISNGYYRPELGVLLSGLYMNFGWGTFLLCVLAVFVQTVAGNKWIGMLVVLALFIGFATLDNFGFEHRLYQFGVPSVPFSDMNGWGHFIERLVSVGAYWTAFSILLVVGAHLLLRRGNEGGWRSRAVEAVRRITPRVGAAAVFGLASWLALGIWIFYNTNVVNQYETQDDLDALQADYEKLYRRYADAPQPALVAVDLAVDIFPESRRIDSRGVALIANTLDAPIEVLHLHVPRHLTINALPIPGTALEENRAHGYHRYRLDDPLRPGERMKLEFDFSWVNEGFPNARSSTRVVHNGTFVNNTEIAPAFGYQRTNELADNNKRRRYGLGPVERLPKYSDDEGRQANQFGVSQRSAFRAVVSTALDQVAIAPGYLEREWQEGGRRYFEYVMDESIWPFLSFQSARYAVAEERHGDVQLQVFHHPEHPFNVQAMLAASKHSLDYFTRAFTPYQYRQFRILEFPAYATFAQSFPNTIPYSEAIGFVADLRDPKDIDYVFYVTAHELAHQWWGHQVIGARMQGMTLIVETLAQYSALMVMEEAYGEERMRRFLKYELDQYLSNRGAEQIEELPLALVENQGYIHYRKGSVAMYALKDAIGEDAVNRALRAFLAKFAFRGEPFPTSGDLIAEFRGQAGPEHQRLISDLFERITLYDVRVSEAEVTREAGGWRVDVTIEGRQLEADGEGREHEVDLEVEADVAVFPAGTDDLGDDDLPDPLLIERRTIRTGSQTFTLFLNARAADGSDATPARVAVDPYHKLIDRSPDDNLRSL